MRNILAAAAPAALIATLGAAQPAARRSSSAFVTLRERQHEADAGPVINAGMQQRAELAEMAGGAVHRKYCNDGFGVSGHAASQEDEDVSGVAGLGKALGPKSW